MRRFPDPAARGTFDAAGDFDRFVNDSYVGYPQGVGLPILQSIDPYLDTGVHSEVMPALLNDIATALAVANDGPERRGLMRLSRDGRDVRIESRLDAHLAGRLSASQRQIRTFAEP